MVFILDVDFFVVAKNIHLPKSFKNIQTLRAKIIATREIA